MEGRACVDALRDVSRSRLRGSDEIAQCTRDEQVEPRCYTTKREARLYTTDTEGLGAVAYVESVRKECG